MRVWKSLTQVNSTDAGVQFQGQVAGLLDGGYVIVWRDESRTYNPSGDAIVGQRYDALGNKVGVEVKLSGFNTGDQFAPAITALSNGNIAVAFDDFHSPDNDIYVRIFDPTLNLVRVDAIDTDNASQTVDPSITALAGGAYAVCYTLQDSPTDSDVMMRIVSPTGAVGVAVNIENATGFQDDPELALLSNGNFVVVYENPHAFGQNQTDINFRIFSPIGVPVGGPRHVFDGADSHWSDVAALRDGGFAAVWETDGDIFLSTFSNTGSAQNLGNLVNTTTTGNQTFPSIVALADGDFLVTWDDATANLVNAQRFDSQAHKVGTEFAVKAGVVGFHNHEAGLLADGRIAYALSDHSGNDYDVTTAIWSTAPADDDFNGDVKSDIVMHNDGGPSLILSMNGSAINGAAFLPDIGPGWQLAAAADFNGDSKSDILWHQDNGLSLIWTVNGASITGGAFLPNIGPGWHVGATADFNRDDKSDVLWQHDSGLSLIWTMNGTAVTGETFLPNIGPGWHVGAAADFNGDLKPDILWQHDSGLSLIWTMNGTGITGGTFLPNLGPGWHVGAAADFNGDGKSDILWHHDSGPSLIWTMNGTAITGGAFLPDIGPDWHVAAAPDFNADGKSDIVWHHDSGLSLIWTMDGTAIIGSTFLPNVGSDWHLL
jgi:hypothetical protein